MNEVRATLLPTAGVLHSAERLLEILSSRPLSAEQIVLDFKHILVCPPHVVLNLSQKCGWVESRSDGLLIVSARGASLLRSGGYEHRLRMQILDYILAEKPPWGRLLSRGRTETAQFAPREVIQVFREARLMEIPPLNYVVEWWDEVARLVRGAAESVRVEVGRAGERRTINRERKRTGVEPIWQAIESNLSGFDVLSVVRADSKELLRIEVKASEESVEHAMFHVTRNEWETASSNDRYLFHLWCFSDEQRPLVAELEAQAVASHIPNDAGKGYWERAKIPFRVFRNSFMTEEL